MKKVCKNCSNVFDAHHSITEFCSKKCSGMFRRYIESAVCQKCGKVFRKRQRDSVGKYCSAKCAGTPRNGKKLRKCLACGKEEMVVASKAKRKFCSPECAYPNRIHHFTKDGLNRLRESKLGRNNWNYKGGDSVPYERDRFYYTGEWKKLRKACFERDKHICQICKKPFSQGRLRAHHIDYRINGGADSLDNLITYCNPCHIKEHYRLDVEHRKQK